MIKLGGGLAADETPVAKDSDPVGDRENLLEPMRDEDDGEPVRLQAKDGVKERIDLAPGKRGRRFIHD